MYLFTHFSPYVVHIEISKTSYICERREYLSALVINTAPATAHVYLPVFGSRAPGALSLEFSIFTWLLQQITDVDLYVDHIYGLQCCTKIVGVTSETNIVLGLDRPPSYLLISSKRSELYRPHKQYWLEGVRIFISVCFLVI